MEQHLNKLGVMAKELDAIGAIIPLEVKVMVFVATLALGSRPKQRACKGAGQD
jgi:hypothetical protein